MPLQARGSPSSLPFHMRVRHLERQHLREEASLVELLERDAFSLTPSRSPVLSPIITPQVGIDQTRETTSLPSNRGVSQTRETASLPSNRGVSQIRALQPHKPGLRAYLEPLWPIQHRAKREKLQREKRKRKRAIKKAKKERQDHDSSFLWCPFFRTQSGSFQPSGPQQSSSFRIL